MSIYMTVSCYIYIKEKPVKQRLTLHAPEYHNYAYIGGLVTLPIVQFGLMCLQP